MVVSMMIYQITIIRAIPSQGRAEKIKLNRFNDQKPIYRKKYHMLCKILYILQRLLFINIYFYLKDKYFIQVALDLDF